MERVFIGFLYCFGYLICNNMFYWVKLKEIYCLVVNSFGMYVILEVWMSYEMGYNELSSDVMYGCWRKCF